MNKNSKQAWPLSEKRLIQKNKEMRPLRFSGRRWNQVPAQNDPQNGFVDADSDGLCDLCGNEQGKNTGAPNFVDSDLNGVCDHFGTELQGQGSAQQAGGRGNPQGQNYIDENNDGQCDIFAAGGQQNTGRGRNRR